VIINLCYIAVSSFLKKLNIYWYRKVGILQIIKLIKTTISDVISNISSNLTIIIIQDITIKIHVNKKIILSERKQEI